MDVVTAIWAAYMQSGAFSARQVNLFVVAQMLFIVNQLTNFPLYYLPGVRDLYGGDGKSAKWPCSISWMTRQGLPRLSTLVLWNLGWWCMLAAVFREGDLAAMTSVDWVRAAFAVQMYATGFLTVVMTPMRGPDVAMGNDDALHCYGAIVYVADHFLVNELIFNHSWATPLGWGFMLSASICGVFQALRTENDALGRKLYARYLGSNKRLSLKGFIRINEYGFAIFENLLFVVFLGGLTSGLRVVEK